MICPKREGLAQDEETMFQQNGSCHRDHCCFKECLGLSLLWKQDSFQTYTLFIPLFKISDKLLL